MMTKLWPGISAIPQRPFDLQGRLDEEILVRRQVISNAYIRRSDDAILDAYDLREIERCLAT